MEYGKMNYQKQLEKILDQIKTAHKKPKLLLHACCAPCSSYVIEYLSAYFDITILYYNPNIYPQEEYERRLSELQNFLPEFPPAVHNSGGSVLLFLFPAPSPGFRLF